MINLLPPDYKANIMYARRNRTLLNWSVALVFALLSIGAIIAGGYLLMNHSINQQTTQSKEAKDQLKNNRLDETKERVDEISDNTKLVLEVLSREILFSDLLRQLGASLPEGTTLQAINIDKIEGGIALEARAKDIQSATQIQVNLADPENKIFQEADIETIDCSGGGEDGSSEYPCTVQLRALFTEDNPYVYISPNGGESP